jgi:putative FmdB family regulatory protein
MSSSAGPDTSPGQSEIIRESCSSLESVTEMPIYEYRCESCSEKFELLTRFAERDTAQACPACESTRTRVMVSSFAVAGAESSESLDFGSAEGGGGCCGGGCGSCGTSPN